MGDFVSNMRFTPYIKPYVEGATKEYAAAQQDARNQYDTNAAGYDAIKEAADKMVALTPDEEAKQAVMNKVRTTLSQAASEGDYENKGRAVRKAYMDFEKEYAPIAKEYSLYQNFVKELDDRKDIDEDKKQKAKDAALHFYTEQRKNGVPLKNPDGTTNGISPFLIKPAATVDVNKKVMDAIAPMVADKTSLSTLNFDPEKQQYYTILNSGREYILKSRTDAAIENAYAGDSTWREYDKSRAYLDNYKLKDEDIKTHYDAIKSHIEENIITPELIASTIKNNPKVANSKNPQNAAILELNKNGYYNADIAAQHIASLEERKLHPKENYTKDYINNLKEDYKNLASANKVHTKEEAAYSMGFVPKWWTGSGSGTNKPLVPALPATVEAGKQTLDPFNAQHRQDIYKQNVVAINESDLQMKKTNEVLGNYAKEANKSAEELKKDFSDDKITDAELKAKYGKNGKPLGDTELAVIRNQMNDYNTAKDNYDDATANNKALEKEHNSIFNEKNLLEIEKPSYSLIGIAATNKDLRYTYGLTNTDLLSLYSGADAKEILSKHNITSPKTIDEVNNKINFQKDNFYNGINKIVINSSGFSSLGYFINADPKKSELGRVAERITSGLKQSLTGQTLAGTQTNLSKAIKDIKGAVDITQAQIVGQGKIYANTVNGQPVMRISLDLGKDAGVHQFDINLPKNDNKINDTLEETYFEQYDNPDVQETIARGVAQRHVVGLDNINDLDQDGKQEAKLTVKAQVPDKNGVLKDSRSKVKVVEVVEPIIHNGIAIKKGGYIIQSQDESGNWVTVQDKDKRNMVFSDYDAVKAHLGKLVLAPKTAEITARMNARKIAASNEQEESSSN